MGFKGVKLYRHVFVMNSPISLLIIIIFIIIIFIIIHLYTIDRSKYCLMWPTLKPMIRRNRIQRLILVLFAQACLSKKSRCKNGKNLDAQKMVSLWTVDKKILKFVGSVSSCAMGLAQKQIKRGYIFRSPARGKLYRSTENIMTLRDIQKLCHFTKR